MITCQLVNLSTRQLVNLSTRQLVNSSTIKGENGFCFSESFSPLFSFVDAIPASMKLSFEFTIKLPSEQSSV